MTVWKALRRAVWKSFRTVSRLYLLLSGRQYRFVFILGHIRSGSSLLAHILANHEDIAGAGETHISYRTPADLPQLVLRTGEFLHRPILRETYMVDQINHPYVSDDVLHSSLVYRCIILIREPDAMIKSTMNMLKCQEQDALDAYVKRLNELAQYGLLLGERAMLVNYDDLVDRTEQALAALTRFLGLASPLTPTYSTHRMTGRIEGYGDPSDNIKAGRIIRTPGYAIALSNDTLVAATRAYRNCQAELLAAGAQALTAPASADERTSVPAFNK